MPGLPLQSIITGDIQIRELDGVLTANDGIVDSVPLGAADGVATLDGSGKVPLAQLPSLPYVGSLTVTAPLTSTGGLNPTLAITLANTSSNGYLSSTDWNTFNNKVPYTGAVSDVNLGTYGLLADYFKLNVTPSSVPSTESTISWNNTDGTMDVKLKRGNVTLQVGLENVKPVINKTGANMLEANYQVARIRTAAEGGAQGQRLAVLLAQGNNGGNSKGVLGLVTEDINNNQEGFLTTFGEIHNINTTGSLQGETWVDGDKLYLSSTNAGGLTNVKPTAPNHAVIAGYVVYAHASNGKIDVGIDEGYELGDLHNMYVPSPSDKNGVWWNASNSRYENNSIAGVLGYTPANDATTLTINGVTYDISTNRTWSVGTVTNVSALTLGTSGTDLNSTVATGTTTPVITLNVPTASAANRGALSAADWSTFNTKVGGVTASSPLFSSGGGTPNITIQVANTSQDGYLSSADWNTFNNKQAAGNYITSLTGEATASGPGAAAVTLSNAAVIAKVLTGINITGGTVVATDTILQAMGKIQNQINGLIGGSIFQSTWNASTNTPSLASGVGTKGYYYIVSVAGSTTLDGITDWNVGDWAIFDGTAWQQVDNTDAVVSVNGFTGAVSLTTDNISEGSTNLYFTNARARAALSFAAGSGAYNSTTGVITIPTNTSQLTNGAAFITLASLSGTAPIGYNSGTGAISITQATTSTNGYLSSTDWNTFNNKQNAIGYTPANDALVVHLSGAETITGIKTFSNEALFGNGITLTGGYITYTSGVYNLTLNTNILTANRNIFLKDGSGTLAFTSDIPSLSGYVQGTGTTNYLPKFTGASTIGNSLIYDNGTQVIIGGTTVPDAGLKTYVTNGTVGIGNYLSSTVGYIGTWTNHSLGLVTNGANRVTIDTSGNVGIGVTPSAWSGGFRFMDIGSGAGAAFGSVGSTADMTNNAFSDGAWSYKSTAAATLYRQITGQHIWFNAPSGTAGNPITFTQAMTLFSDGNLALNTTTNSGYKLDVNGTGRFSGSLKINGGGSLNIVPTSYGGNGFVSFRNTADSATRWNIYNYTQGGVTYGSLNFADGSGTDRLVINEGGAATFSSSVTLSASDSRLLGGNSAGRLVVSNSDTSTYLICNGSSNGNDLSLVTNSQIIFTTGSGYAERMRITSGGNVGIGTSSPNAPLHVQMPSDGSAGVIFRYIGGSANPGLFISVNETTKHINLTGSGSSVGGQQLRLGAEGVANVLNITGSNVLIGTTTDAGYKLDVNGTGRFSGNVSSNGNIIASTGVRVRKNTTADGANDLGIFYSNSGDFFYLYDWNTATKGLALNTGTGAATFSSSVSASAFFETSDKRLKQELIDNPTSVNIGNIKPKLYIKNGKEELGYYAQDFLSILPSAVSEGSDGMLSLSYSQVLVAKVSRLEQEIKELKAKLN